MSNGQIQAFVDGQMEATVSWAGGSETLKINHDVFVSDQHASVSIQGWALFNADRRYYVVDIWLPRKDLGLPKHEMGYGEEAPAGAYLGSNTDSGSGFAKSGLIHDTEWNESTGLFKTNFEFVVDTDTAEEVKVKGSVVVNKLKRQQV
ncbi:hypothetical protein E2H86_24575 [Pseudomonas putida]|uniref:hypothetical protein n=1 Tax=Pseudomonas TaxID=286 RepID=UPI00105A72A9|nr:MULTISPECIES: hypothetical protein [Pseudomonas]MBF8745702.1 hypothetical protein [Pseudomonas monteilii]MCT8162620.1 hypothetical protein [Pseudomonas sp. HD6422]MCT8184298.1 hypothetical protein [Pseudomonas sp. HD6421]TDJ73136.1 hypothetical protein E2H86_24575 [Pseudomonas putida]